MRIFSYGWLHFRKMKNQLISAIISGISLQYFQLWVSCFPENISIIRMRQLSIQFIHTDSTRTSTRIHTCSACIVYSLIWLNRPQPFNHRTQSLMYKRIITMPKRLMQMIVESMQNSSEREEEVKSVYLLFNISSNIYYCSLNVYASENECTFWHNLLVSS